MPDPTPQPAAIAACRGCGRALRGKPFSAGGTAYHPDTNERCPANYYGGYVCSEACDVRASLALEQSMPGHSHEQTRLGGAAQQGVRQNWSK